MQFRYKPLREMIGEIWLSILDGARTPHSRNSAYYRVVMCAMRAPSRLFKKNEDLKKLTLAADHILTGGGVNNQNAVI